MTIEEIKEQKLTTNFAWIKSKYEQGYLHLNGEAFTNETFEQFRLFVKITNEIYTDSWDIDISVSDLEVDIIGIVIHFPEITITNKNLKQHKIKDLFVRISLKIKENRLSVRNIEGARTTFSYKEYSSKYVHSHLHRMNHGEIGLTTNLPIFDSFCLGSGEINIYKSDLNTEGFSEDTIYPFLMQIMSLVSYESIEGTPYMYLERISLLSADNVYIPFSTNIWFNLGLVSIRDYQANSLIPDLDFMVENSKYVLRDNEKFVTFLKRGVVTGFDKDKFLCFLGPDGKYYKYNTSHTIIDIPRVQKPYIFRGEKKYFKVEEMPSEDTFNNVEYTIHPKIRLEIKKIIEDEINKNTIRESTKKRYSDRINNARKSLESDKISV